MGVDPAPLTLAELVDMAEASERSRWAHTSFVVAMIANTAPRKKGSRSFKPEDFDPYALRDKRQKSKADAAPTDWDALRNVWKARLKQD